MMNNKEKKEYLSLMAAYASTPMMHELERRSEFNSKIPQKLYKYRRFDEHSFEMLDSESVYLAPANCLDDPFDCLSNLDLTSMSEDGTFTMTDDMADYIAETILSYPHSGNIKKDDLKMVIKCSVKNGEIDNDFFDLCTKNVFGFPMDQTISFDSLMGAFNGAFKTLSKDNEMKRDFLVLSNSRENFGVCAFTTKRDNQPMWSLYADMYKGYCVEYTTPNLKNIIRNLLPVIYSKDKNNDLIKIMVGFSMAIAIRGYTDGGVSTPMLGSFYELLCTKDTKWKYQDEWRLVGTPKLNVDNFPANAVYLGFNVSDENEKKMIECSKRNGFEVYKMNNPTGYKKIAYSKIN